MNEILNTILSQARFDALNVDLTPVAAVEGETALRALLTTVLAGQPELPAAGRWTIRRFGGADSVNFDLIAPADHTITTKQAFDLKNALARQASVTFAEAMFDTVATIMPDEMERPDDGAAAEDGADTDAGQSFSILGFLSNRSWFDELTEAEKNVDWNHNMVKTKEAWQLSPAQGEGIVIGHPDTGFMPHFELAAAHLDAALGVDLVGDLPNALNTVRRGGNHGLGTMSLIVGEPGTPADQPRSIFGVAPNATIIPYRIAPDWAPVFVTPVGPRRVRDAVRLARQQGCHVLSMSLGGIPSRKLQEEIEKAAAEDIIICAAAGNVVRIVVWPALHEEVIAVAACGADGEPWFHSSRGRAVDITAPGHNVWRAKQDDDGLDTVRPGSGTSYATPHVAAAAALWLAKHGRVNLQQRYPGVPLYKVFRWALRRSAEPMADKWEGRFGAGILNIARLLALDLPDPALFAAAATPFSAGGGTVVDAFCQVFDEIPRPVVRARLAELLDVADDELDGAVVGLNEDELLFHVITTPALRQFFDAPQPEAAMAAFVVSQADAAASPARRHLLSLDLSDEFRGQVAA